MKIVDRVSAIDDRIASLGQVMQLAFCPQDYDAAVQFWTETMGAGPFFLLEDIQLDNLRYRGEPAKILFSMLLGYWGDMQIEIIRPHDNAPSIYSAWRKAGLEGIHHVCITVDDMDHARRVCTLAGAEVVQEGTMRNGAAEFIYVDTHGGPGTMIEIAKLDRAGVEFFTMLRDAARNWDGMDPIRILG